MKGNDLISVIIPVYNVAKYLERCVQSVSNQTYRNLEIILVDDGSTDGSERICDRAAERDGRVKVIHQKNGGVSCARNTGLETATGKYIAFIDSDDYVADDYIEYLYGMLSENGGEIAICDCFDTVRDDAAFEDTEHAECQVMSGREAIREMCYQHGIPMSLWAKMFERELFCRIRFPEGRIYEDVAVLYRLFDRAEQIVRGRSAKYAYYQRRDGIVRDTFSEEKLAYVEYMEELLQFVGEKYPDIRSAAEARYVWANLNLLAQIPGRGYAGIQERLMHNVRKYRKTVLRDSEVPFQQKGILILTWWGPELMRWCYRMRNRRLRGRENEGSDRPN